MKFMIIFANGTKSREFFTSRLFSRNFCVSDSAKDIANGKIVNKYSS